MRFNFIRRTLLLGSLVLAIGGCSSSAPLSQTGFLSDYANLQTENENSLRYLAPGNALGGYTAFIIEPVRVYHYTQSSPNDLPDSMKDELAIYMRGTIVEAIADGYDIVSQPGPGVARVRVALTDIKKSSVGLNILPTTRMTGLGLGGASVEAEIVDSVNGHQIAALVEARLAQRLNLAAGWSDWGDAKSVMDAWAKRFRQRLDEAND